MSTPSGGSTDFHALRDEFADTWWITVDYAGTYHATLRGISFGEEPVVRTSKTIDDLRRQLREFEAARVAFRTGDLP